VSTTAEHLTRTQHRQQGLAPVVGRCGELHLAVGEQIEAVSRLALVEQHVAATQAYGTHHGAKLAGRFGIEHLEEREPLDLTLGHRSPRPSDAARDDVAV
jgi:hypothetical protein